MDKSEDKKEFKPSLNTLNRVLNGTLDNRNDYIVAYHGNLSRLASYLIEHDIPLSLLQRVKK
jgi:hypothetical protein